MTSDELLNNQKLLKNNKALCNESLEVIIKSALVEKFPEGDERPCNEGDFRQTKNEREKIILDLRSLIENKVDNCAFKSEQAALENESLALLFILCGQNVSLRPWNNAEIVKNCNTILSQVVKLFSCEDFSEFLSKHFKNNLIKLIFQILCPDLTVATWKHFPASVACYEWILGMIIQPELSQYLQFILPPALMLTDDYVNENKITGTKCLHHIIDNITLAELQLCGHGNVIYSAMIPLLRIREPDLINSTVPPLVSLTTKLEFDLGKKDVTKWSRFDEILEIYLENMELEQVIALRDCYIRNLGLLVNETGFRIIRWSKRLLRIFFEYISTAKKYNEEKTMNSCLKVIEKYIELSSEVISLNAESLLTTLVCALHYANSCHNEIQRESKEITVRCIKVLLKSFPQSEREEVEKIFQEKFSISINP